MFDHLKEYNIYIKSGFADMRKREGNLSLLVRSEMGMDPIEKIIFQRTMLLRFLLGLF